MQTLSTSGTDMPTQTISGVNPLPIDHQILALIDDESDNPHAGNTRGIAILNAEGQLYRMIFCSTPGRAYATVGRLMSLGLIDRVDFNDSTFRDVDSLTGEIINTDWSAIMQMGTTPHPLPAVPPLDF